MERLLVEFVLNRRWGDQKEEKDLQGLNSAVDVVLVVWFLESWNNLRAVLAADTEVWVELSPMALNRVFLTEEEDVLLW